MQDKDSNIVLRAGQEKLISPGKEGYVIKCEVGALALPMVPLPTGHMLISRDHYSEQASDKDHMVYNTDHAVEVERENAEHRGHAMPSYSSSSSQ